MRFEHIQIWWPPSASDRDRVAVGNSIDLSLMDIDDLATRIDLDRRATAYSVDVVDQARESDLDRPTPCAEWTCVSCSAT